jgi:hypothetical protein
MIKLEFHDPIYENEVGKLLLMSMAILSGEDKFKEMTPDQIFDEIKNLANRVYHEEEWKIERGLKMRLDLIEEILSNK